MKRLAVLGSTGSIGTSTMSLVEEFPDRFEVVALAAGHNIDLLRAQIAHHQPSLVAVARVEDAKALAREFSNARFVAGDEGLDEVAGIAAADIVVSALVGAIGLAPTVTAIRAGKDIALANKEALVVAGDLVMTEADRSGIHVMPVDSEHAALQQILAGVSAEAVARVILTASGGPFLKWSSARIAGATAADALAHPTWSMGAKITIDSATMMNKGLEVIEAHHLFALPEERIGVIVHPQSLVHCIVEHVDGTLVAQMAANDMRLPILSALAWPDRVSGPVPTLDLTSAPQLEFEAPDEERFPALGLARSALRAGGEMTAALNAANEVAVSAFLDGRCPLPAIMATVEETLTSWNARNRPLADIEQALAVDREARLIAREQLRKYLHVEIGSE